MKNLIIFIIIAFSFFFVVFTWFQMESNTPASYSTITTQAPSPIPTLYPTIPPIKTYYYSPSAICNDGTYSYSLHRQGTCSHHGGVDSWY